ncbi:tail fiber domain-containing protein [Flavobacterium chuncheonense]|uniref:Tail fiber domain-containing protein n=1 Tax=Flavobacterium chuncheonense TaxID=2026653 RepID=A0ABW5YKZ5_9FLAO
MKKITTLIIHLLFFSSVFAQVGIGTNTPDTSASLDVSSTTQGLLIPRLTEVQKNNINTPANGLLIYQTDGIKGVWYFNGTFWQPLGGNGNNWSITTNSNTNPYTNKLGTLDNNPIIFKTNDSEAGRISSSGNTGINLTSPLNTKLTVKSSFTPAYIQDFESYNSSYNFSTSSTQTVYWIDNNDATCTNSQGWRISTSNPLGVSCANCTSNRAFINSTVSCLQQDATLVVKLGTFVENQVLISFTYGYSYLERPDSFTVTLYNETTNNLVETLVKEFGEVYSTSIPQTFSNFYKEINITPGHQYSLRFRYIGKGYSNQTSDGAIVDNIIVTPFTPAFRLEDGNQANGKVLMSDANGNGTWTDASASTTDDDWQFNSGNQNTDPIYRTGSVRIGSFGTPRALLDVLNYSYSTGTKVGIGSKEFFVDGNSEFMVSNSLVPSIDNALTLGTILKRWRQITTINGVITTSDRSEKTNIKSIKYGLEDLRKLKPVTYYWKKEYTDFPKRQLGFLAQDLLKTIPEVVQNKAWIVKKDKIKRSKVHNLSVCYSELLPITVKSIQEHQVTLTTLEKEIDQLLQTTNTLVP